MASIRDFAITVFSTATASMVCEMPTHESGDLLVAFVNKDTASNFTTPSGWTLHQNQVSNGAGGGVYSKRAASSSETVTFALTIETCCAVIIAVKNCNGTTEADAVSGSAKSGADDSTLPITGIGITPSHDNCLILHGISGDGGYAYVAQPPWVNLFDGDTGANSLCVAYTHQAGTAAAITAPDHWGQGNDDTRGFIIAIRGVSSNDTVSPYIPLSQVPAVRVSALTGVTGTVDGGTYTAAASIALTTINGKTVTGVTLASTLDSGINPFRSSTRNAGVSSTTNLNHVELPLSASVDLTAGGGLLFGTFMFISPRDYVDTGSPQQGGVYLVAGSDASNYRCWVVGGQFSKTTKSDARNNYLIEVASSDTVYGSAGTPSYSAMDFLAFGGAGYYGANNIIWNELWRIDGSTLAGGSLAELLDFDDIVFAVIRGNALLPLIQQFGSSGVIWTPLKFGGPAAIHIECVLNTFQMPRKADEIDYADFHVSNNKIGYEFDGQVRDTGDFDTLHFLNCVFTSPSSYYWRFASTHDDGVDMDFSGTSVVNAAVTLRSTVSLSSMTFIDCGSFTQNNAALTDCSFSNTKITSDNPADIVRGDFTSGGTGHAIEITTAGTYTFDGNLFSGYGAGGTTDAAVYNNSGGAVTLNIINGGDTPTIRNGAGASTVVNNAVTITLNSLVAGSRVYIEDLDDTAGLVLFNEIEATSTFSDTVNYTGDRLLLIRVRKASSGALYKPYETTALLTSAGITITVNQVADE